MAKRGMTSVQYRAPKQCPPHQTEYFERTKEIGHQPSEQPGDQALGCDPARHGRHNRRRPIATAIHGLKMNKPRFGLNKVPAAPSTRLPDHAPSTPWSRGCSCLELRLASDDRPEVPKVVDEQQPGSDDGHGQEPEQASRLRSGQPTRRSSPRGSSPAGAR